VIRALLLFVALAWGAAMQMGYMQLQADPKLSARTKASITLLFYLIALLSLLVMVLGGEWALVGYLVSMLFVGAYRESKQPRKRKKEKTS
jgi:hypothetical protein